jgi:hypothetical protein
MAGYIRQPFKRSETLQQQPRNSEGGAVPVAQPPLLESCTADCWVTHMQLDQRNGFVALVLSTMTYWGDGTGTMSRKMALIFGQDFLAHASIARHYGNVIGTGEIQAGDAIPARATVGFNVADDSRPKLALCIDWRAAGGAAV